MNEILYIVYREVHFLVDIAIARHTPNSYRFRDVILQGLSRLLPPQEDERQIEGKPLSIVFITRGLLDRLNPRQRRCCVMAARSVRHCLVQRKR